VVAETDVLTGWGFLAGRTTVSQALKHIPTFYAVAQRSYRAGRGFIYVLVSLPYTYAVAFPAAMPLHLYGMNRAVVLRQKMQF